MGGPLPLVPTYRHRYELDEGREVLVVANEEERAVRVVSGGETYLRLLDVDLDDPESILGFANQYGHLGVYETTEDWRAIRYPLSFQWDELEPKLRAARLKVGQVQLDADRRWIEALEDPSQRETYTKLYADRTAEDMAWQSDPSYESLEEFRAGAAAVIFAVGFWRLLLGEMDYRQLIERTGVGPGSAAREAADYLYTFFDWGLEPFHPHLSVDWDGPVTSGTFDLGPQVETLPQSRRGTNLYNLCCLELYNHIVEGANYRTCANEPCGRTFVRQEGRAEHGQYRTKGVKYCSATCARAQAQRELRRRKRQES
jgi:hypothetical protein